jgi:hypothetical protein
MAKDFVHTITKKILKKISARTVKVRVYFSWIAKNAKAPVCTNIQRQVTKWVLVSCAEVQDDFTPLTGVNL